MVGQSYDMHDAYVFPNVLLARQCVLHLLMPHVDCEVPIPASWPYFPPELIDSMHCPDKLVAAPRR